MSDFRREYQISGDELGRLDTQEFSWLLQGLSTRSRFVQAWEREPKHLHDPSDIAAVHAAARR